jgi:ParB family transcriptional regulator, chromosome partitioning protein
MADDGRSRLGRGLAALMGDVGEEPKTTTERAKSQRRVPIAFLKPNPRNPRRDFADADLDELAASVKERGVIQPIVTRPVRGKTDTFEIIAGERRWRAAQRAGQHDVPIVVIEATDDEALQLAIIENVQRADLNPLEEAAGYASLASDFSHSHDQIAKIVGKSRTHVTNSMRLLKLSEPVQALIRAGKLSAGHARMLIGQPNALELAEDIIARGLNVRQVEEMARKSGQEQAKEVKRAFKPARSSGGKDADTVALEKRVSDALGLKVTVDHDDDGGVLHIHYSDLEQLDEVLRRLERGG